MQQQWTIQRYIHNPQGPLLVLAWSPEQKKNQESTFARHLHRGSADILHNSPIIWEKSQNMDNRYSWGEANFLQNFMPNPSCGWHQWTGEMCFFPFLKRQLVSKAPTTTTPILGHGPYSLAFYTWSQCRWSATLSELSLQDDLVICSILQSSQEDFDHLTDAGMHLGLRVSIQPCHISSPSIMTKSYLLKHTYNSVFITLEAYYCRLLANLVWTLCSINVLQNKNTTFQS